MLNCAYCDTPCKPTREHVIPNWYNRTPGDASTFNARAPMTQRDGDILVKDVCQKCNNGILSELDNYGKLLYDQFFANPLYLGDTVEFEYDGDRFLRWLLKLSYNSARVHNADSRILRDYRKMMLGEIPLTGRVRCWLTITAPTLLQGETVRPAATADRGLDEVAEPLWFRITQFRLLQHRADNLVLRTVMLNSFRFTIAVNRFDAELPSAEMEAWAKAFMTEYPAAIPLLPGVQKLRIHTTTDDYMASLSQLYGQYPSRFLGNTDPHMQSAARREVGGVGLLVTPEMIHSGDQSDIAGALHGMVGNRENTFSFRQLVHLQVSGYDNDPRGLWMIPEVREYFRTLLLQCPFVIWLAHQKGSLLKVLALCWTYEEAMTDEEWEHRMAEFYDIAFQGLNELAHRMAISEEANREICFAAAEAITGEKCPNRDA